MMAAMETLAFVPGAVVHGFEVQDVRDVRDVGAKMVQMRHVRTGAELVWLDRDDDNKTFSVSFKTVPSDDTGVAHIIEHSVLCGSRSFPVKEPFVELLKSSLQTFLNAMTDADMTIYPISSRNDHDYLNLAEIYLDAVFHPLSVEREWIMRQEGWRYEPQDNGALALKGVVYSEMRGAYADPDTVCHRELMRLLFPDTTYGHDSGGDPAHIPELTYDGYKAFYHRHYHPSNAYFFLDGRVDMAATLALIERYLAPFGPGEGHPPIPMQRPVTGKATVQYESDEVKDRAIVADGYVFGTFDEREKAYGFEVLSEVLAGSNEAPLAKALISAGLCEDVDLASASHLQQVAVLRFVHTAPEKAEECRRVARDTIMRLCREGLDRAQVTAILDRIEFRERERDTGAFPRGLALMCAVLGGWVHGGDPARELSFSQTLESLRRKATEGWFEAFMREVFIDCPHHAELDLIPSAMLADERRLAAEAALAATRASMGEAELGRIAAEAKALRALQSTPDPAESIAKLPRLALADIPADGALPAWQTSEVDGVRVLRPAVETGGIAYIDLCFSLDGLSDEELLDVAQLSELLGELATENYGALAIKRELDGRLGRFEASPHSYKTGPQFVVHVSALESRLEDAARLASEVLLRTCYDDARAIRDIRRQSRLAMENMVKGGGYRFAAMRAASSFSEMNRITELFDGISQLRRLQEDAAPDFAALARKVFTRQRLLASVAGNVPDAFVSGFAGLLPEGVVPFGRSTVRPSGLREANATCAEGFEMPSDVGFSAMVACLPEGKRVTGAHVVASQILSLDYLWNEIRLKGGAYGGRFGMGIDGGELVCGSWNDPSPARSFGVFAAMGDALEEFVKSGQDMEKYQVASVGRLEPYRSPRAEAARATWLHLSGRGPQDIARLRSEILSVTREELLDFAATLRDAFARRTARCAIGGSAQLRECALERIESVTPLRAGADGI